jgi:hypothetical protein
MGKRRKGARAKNPQNRPPVRDGSGTPARTPGSVSFAVPADTEGKRLTLDRDRLHPSLRDLPEDSDIPVIMVGPDAELPENRAGVLLGTLSEPYRLPSGETVPAGYRVYRDLDPEKGAAGDIPSGLIRRPAPEQVYGPPKSHMQAMAAAEEDDPLTLDVARKVTELIQRDRNYGLAQELAKRGTVQPNEALSVKLSAARATLGHPENLSRDLGMPGQGSRLEVTSSGSGLPGWFEVHTPGPPQTHHMRPGDVLDVHSQLARIMMHPPEGLLEFFDAFVTDTMAKAGAKGGDWEKINRWAGMFWPAQTAKEWCGILAHQLRTARTYHVSGPMVDAVDDLYRESDHRLTYVEHDDIPWPAGFAYLDKPVRMIDPHGHVIYNRAYSWDTVYIPYRETRMPGVRVISWSHPDDEDSYWNETTRTMMRQYGGLGMGNTLVFPFGERIYARTEPGQPPVDSVPRWLRCLWITLESVIGTTRRVPPDEVGRGARKRAQHASLVHGEVNVVILRRHLTMAEPGEGLPRGDGTIPRHDFRWPVDEFWRHVRRDAGWEEANIEVDDDGRRRRHHAVPDTSRTRCAICGAKVSFIATFIKGPPGKPLRQRRQLYKLTR